MNRQDKKTIQTGSAGYGSTSFALIQDVKNADAEAWQRLVRLYTPLITYWCRQIGVPEKDLADLTQEVFRSLSDAISKFHGDQEGDTFRGWLRTITRNKVHDYLRRQKRTPSAVGGSDHQNLMARFPHLANQSVGAESEDSAAPFRIAMELVRGEFEQRTWQAFWRTAVDGQTSTDIATELGMSSAAVRKAKSRILSRLRSELSNPLEADE